MAACEQHEGPAMPRRHVTLLAAFFSLVATPLLAQEGEPATATIEPEIFLVTGLAMNDALNIRASASATGMTIARVPNGTQFRNLGCEMVSSYLWCKIVALEDERLIGWAPGRYLPGAVANDGSRQAEDTVSIKEKEAEIAAEGLMGDVTFDEPGTAKKSKSPLATGAIASVGETEVPKSIRLPGIIQRPYSADAKGVVVSLPDGIAMDPAAPAADAAPSAGAEPEQAAEPAAEEAPQVVAAAPEPATTARAFDATSEIPCARYLGQPMSMCRAGVVRDAEGKASVTVDWPDGGKRVIRFSEGRVEGSDSAQPLNVTREADLNMIRIGKTERFEIPDALPFGG